MRRVPLILVIAVVSFLLAPAASAGGAWLTGPRELGVGQSITFRGTFGSGTQARVSAGPWFGYLAPDHDLRGRSEPSFLGPVEIRPSKGRYCCWVASLTFTVPDVKPGSYWVLVCDLGCHTGVGDLIGAEVFIAATVREARLVHDLRDARTRLEVARSRVDASHRARARLEGRVDLLEEEVSKANVTIGALDRARDRMAAELATQRQRANGLRWLVIVFAVALLLIVAVAGWRGKARRRTKRPAVRNKIVRPDDAVLDPDRELALRR